MKLQNLQMRGGTLSLRYTRDRDGKPIQIVGDENGVFDFSKVNADDKAFMRNAPGWHPLPKDKRDLRGPAAPPKPAPSTRDTVANGPSSSAESTDEESGGKSAGEDEGPDIDALRTKAAARTLAAEYRAKGFDIPELDDSEKLSTLKGILEDAIYGTNAAAEEEE